MEWMSTASGLITLITGLVGLIGTGVSAFFAIKTLITSLKDKKLSEIWNMIQLAADAAMKEAEKSSLKGLDKKNMVIESVKASCKSMNVNIDDFIDQLSAYIDQTITFVNDMNK